MTGFLLQLMLLSLLAVGGINALMPELHRQVVEVNGWLSSAQFTDLFALAQAAPGPNILVVPLLGWYVGGLLGALGALLALCGPSSVLALFAARGWQRLGASRGRDAIRDGLAPVTIGLVLASGYVIARLVDQGWGAAAITAGATALALGTRLNPLWLIAGGAALGLAGLA